MSLTKKLNQNLFNIILLFFFTISSGFAENKIVGKAKVIDGDTIKIKNNKIRLSGIDAPESNQLCKRIFLSIQFFSFNKQYPCGKISTNKLKKLVKNEIILCKVENIDRYKRKLATCFKNRLNINSWLVRNGYALAYVKYSKKYIFQEKEAERDKLGMWQGTFEKPWDWRKNEKKK